MTSQICSITNTIIKTGSHIDNKAVELLNKIGKNDHKKILHCYYPSKENDKILESHCKTIYREEFSLCCDKKINKEKPYEFKCEKIKTEESNNRESDIIIISKIIHFQILNFFSTSISLISSLTSISLISSLISIFMS